MVPETRRRLLSDKIAAVRQSDRTRTNDAGLMLLATRVEAGLSQRELATRAGTSGATIAAYERGTKEPRLSTLRRLLDAAGMRLELAYAPAAKQRRIVALTREEQRSLALHRAIAARLATHPRSVLAKARRNLTVMRRANTDGSAERWLAEWQQRLRGPLAGIIEALVSTDQDARDLRQVTPFAGVLSDEERRAIYRADTAA
jgi:transcriptional regulator with XRE-family HTH domain